MMADNYDDYNEIRYDPRGNRTVPIVYKAYSNPDVSQFEGASKGALSGLIGRSLSYVGGGYSMNNIIWGSVEGSLTSMIDACI